MGLIGWARKLIDVFMDGASDTVDHQTGLLLPKRDGVPRYYRFEAELPPGMGAMDDTSAAHLAGLMTAAQTLISTNGTALDQLCALLSETS